MFEGLATAGWTYRRMAADEGVEYGTVQGHDVALPAHFHDEDQITFVLTGRRRFALRGAITTIEAGRCALIPAGVVHRSLPEPAGTDCLNVYMPAADYALAALLDDAQKVRRDTATVEAADLVAVIRRHRLALKNDIARRISRRTSVAERAEEIGMTREGFSRAFARRHDMPPHAFEHVTRLNHARRLLRHGETIAAAAFDAGFADQSHLGRCFRRAFGVTPGQYREHRSSQTYQTRP